MSEAKLYFYLTFSLSEQLINKDQKCTCIFDPEDDGHSDQELIPNVWQSVMQSDILGAYFVTKHLLTN